MGVMPCSRNGCINILCSKYSYKHGYLCDECFRELKSFIIMSAPKSLFELDDLITNFIEMYKDDLPLCNLDIDEYINREFESLREYL